MLPLEALGEDLSRLFMLLGALGVPQLIGLHMAFSTLRVCLKLPLPPPLKMHTIALRVHLNNLG